MDGWMDEYLDKAECYWYFMSRRSNKEARAGEAEACGGLVLGGSGDVGASPPSPSRRLRRPLQRCR